MPVWLLFLSTLFLTSCEGSPADTVGGGNPIREASAFVQGDKLYARATLAPDYLHNVMLLLRHGEPILATYQFQFYRVHPWLPDVRLASVVIKRRLRLRLINRRYQMSEGFVPQTHYTPNPNEAMRFWGHPEYILLGTGVRLPKTNRYRLLVRLSTEHQGMSQMFRMLNRWLTLNNRPDYPFHSEFKHP